MKPAMVQADVIIVGAGPAGAACAARLKKRGMDVMILEKQVFPRPKLCAGWITPNVFDSLECPPEAYPYALTHIRRMHFHLFGIRVPVKTHQYAIRRMEFDQWLVRRANVPMHTHPVKQIRKNRSGFVIDDQFECRYLVGAGGTHCPVRRTFVDPLQRRPEQALISAVEKEFQGRCRRRECHIWYLDRGLPGYAWYLPKKDGWINIGIGGKQHRLASRGTTIMMHWHNFVHRLLHQGFLDQPLDNPKGHTYFLRHKPVTPGPEKVFVIGDAAGLSTRDMGEGIHAAVQSGIAAAEAITSKQPAGMNHIARFSLPKLLTSAISRSFSRM
ncbi:MAG TPA: NAD(P)/FAD-dependent oxidoreductase [Desulfotignum sp.]|nr:NAD(P)/FAD-dependent oxidoreductase [Desulfotignum sp.]